MKFQTRKIVTLIAAAALSLSAISSVGAIPYDPCAPTSIAAQMACDPCAPASITSMGMDPCATPEPTEEPAVATPAPINMEQNVSFNDADLGVSLFKAEDADGNVQMNLYHTDTGSSTSSYLFSITQDDIAPYLNELPTENTLLASAEGVSVYVLTTGEIQVNAGPDAEGKTHVKIFNGIPWTHVYGYTIDAQ